ncbi:MULTISPECIES: hypothetical protein [unclassified Novosphingobium]|uniref:hypothetical protein n=1 Tax=unclassified Novosphingobium TaxID=2644732 RepID=UPI0025F2BF86|nr:MULTISPECIES: hypothetical protein [unclassified Novosphingobium]HQV04422.1 hypothetical protein [Novosphingobium sp.]
MAVEAFSPSGNLELRQGEILSGLTIHDYLPQEDEVQPKIKRYAIIVNQDCDLLQDFDKRKSGLAGNLEYILLIEGQLSTSIKASIGGRDLWKPVENNKNERFQLFSAVPPERDSAAVGLPSLTFDFRSVFCLATNELYRQINAAEVQRRCILNDMYRENFQLRFANFLSRVLLPVPHRFTA